MNTISTIAEEFDNIDKIKIFEIEVLDNRTNMEEYLTFDISIEGNKFIATHEATNKQEEESNKIPFVHSEIEEHFDLDANLQELYYECINKIINSEFYTLL